MWRVLPAEILYNVARYVCREWYTTIEDPRFVSTHFPLSTSTLLMNRGSDLDVYRLLDVRECDAKLTDFKFQLPTRVKLMSTCNGLLLMRSQNLFDFQKKFYVGNPITRKILALPELSSFMTPISCNCSLVFEASSKRYKVVVVIEDQRFPSPRHSSHDQHYGCAIMTVGVDEAWRVLNLTHLDEQHTPTRFIFLTQHSVAGFIYWASRNDSCMFALDIESEIIKPIASPCSSRNYLMPKGNSISLLHISPKFTMEVWVLKDPRTGEWVKFSRIEGRAIRNHNLLANCKISTGVEGVYPVTWLGNGQKILFRMAHILQHDSNKCRHYDHFFVYDLNTHACSEFDNKCDKYREFVPFINSLSWA